MIVSSDSLSCDPHPVIIFLYEQITGPLVRSVALKTKGAAGPSGIDTQGWRWRRLCSCLSVIRGTVVQSWSVGSTQLVRYPECPLVGGWLNTSSVVISFGATASVHYREVVRSWEGLLWEVPLYTHLYSKTIFMYTRLWGSIKIVSKPQISDIEPLYTSENTAN